MNKRQNPQPNPLLASVCIRIGLLEKDSKTSYGSEKGKAHLIFNWILESSTCTFIGWIGVNLIADYGTRPNRSDNLAHSNWALQSTDLLVNALILILIISAQVFRFALVIAKEEESKVKRSTKNRRLFALYLISLILIIFWRMSFLDGLQYGLFIPNAQIFSILWVIVSTIFFTGLVGFWPYLLSEIFRKK